MGLDIPTSKTGFTDVVAAQFPYLPVDVERLIIETAARLDIRTALRLVQVCRLYRRWSSPDIYRAVTLKSTLRARQFSTTLASASCPLSLSSFDLAGRVRVLNFSNDVDVLTIGSVVPLCHNLVSVAYWGVRSKIIQTPLVDISPCKSLRRLSMDLRHIVADPKEPLPLDHPLHRVTHLDVCSPNLFEWSHLISQLSGLTHLFFCEDYPSRIPSRITTTSLFPPNLRVCIVHVAVGLISQDIESLKDCIYGDVNERVVIGTESFTPERLGEGGGKDEPPSLLLRSFPQLLLDWSDASPDHVDVWDMAEEIIAARRTAKRLPKDAA